MLSKQHALERCHAGHHSTTPVKKDPKSVSPTQRRAAEGILQIFPWTDFAEFRSSKNEWLNESFLQLNGVEVRDQVEKTWVNSYKQAKRFANDFPEVSKVAKILREETTSFKELVPVIEALGNKAMKTRHWSRLAEETGCDIIPDEFLTLQGMLDVGIQDHWDKVDEVSVNATKQYGLETKLDALIEAWEPVELFVKPYKESGTFIIGGTEEVFQLLDDQVVTVQTMLGSSFIKFIKNKAQAFERKLVYAQDVLDEWLAVQRTWMYLTPIFSSPDIMRQMPTEGRRFQKVDQIWRNTMTDVVSNPNMMNVASNEKLLGNFKEANNRLDQIQKGLEDYLEIKRLAFSRFFFLSNDELLEILSQTKDPTAVQPYLNKIFEGVGKVRFRFEDTGKPEDQQIIAMVSGEGETVNLMKVVDPNAGKNRGNVEMWLKQLQSSMRYTVKDEVMKSIDAYPKGKRVDWFWNWPAQCVLNVSQLYWTKEVEDALSKHGNQGLQDYLDVLQGQLNDVVDVVRGKITKLQRRLMQALCTLDVHARAVIQEMYDKGCNRKSDFEWLSQLRYYWEEKPDDYLRYNDEVWPGNLMARILNAYQMYGYEYLGCSGRLVITPLTDRCYRTLMGAVALMFGGAPAGPAGTGKTETTKDLSKACAIQCIVLNCSPEFDYKAMGKFFKGLAQSGSWSCFDEFNRIILEVLSVIAQQILTLQNAKRARVKTFEFEGTNLTLNPDANVFITMNPGYAGRQELPDNLKALFRPCAMMVPDYALIAEVMLFAKGFLKGTDLARKLTQVLRLSSELLSSQKHYDYGMRAVFSILVRAGNLRLELGEVWTEPIIVLSAITDVNLPKFTSNDIPLFRGIVSDLFPGVEVPTADYGALIPTIKEVCVENHLQPTDNFVSSTIQLFETVQVRHGLMVVGQSFSGKTSIFRTLQEAMGRMEGEDFPPKVNIHTINPKSVASTQLYGSFDPNTHEWTNGVLAVIYRDASKDLSGASNWLLFDGPVDTLWIESMNTVLDDNKKLCLVSGEIIKMSPYMRMMFEPADLDEASPATVSRVGVVFMEPARLGWEPILQSWLQQLPKSTLREQSEHILGVMHWLLMPSLFFVTEYCKRPTPITKMEMANNVFRLFSCMSHDPFQLHEDRTRAQENDGDVDSIPIARHPMPSGKDLLKYIENLAIFCIIWSLGGVIDKPGRALFDTLLRSLLTGTLTENEKTWTLFLAKNPHYNGDAKENRKMQDKMPEQNTVFDYRYNSLNLKWEGWMKMMGKEESLHPDAKFNDIIIPTIDTVRNEMVVRVLMEHNCHVLITGQTGTGKSVSVSNLLTSGLDQSKYTHVFVQFSAQTTENQTQDIIDGKLGKRRKGVFGPPPGFTSVIFVDDLNMPKKEEYGAQPPIELLRAWMDHGGWYDRFDPSWSYRKIQDIQFVAAMGPPGGGRSNITQRYVRHFNMLNYVPFDDSSLVRIFTKIVGWSLGSKNPKVIGSPSFNSSVKKIGDSCVQASIRLYNSVMSNLLPTPLKSHYTFNLRDLAKVFQGLSQADSSNVDEPIKFIRMWGHECCRVFQDRLVSQEDHEIFQSCLNEVCEQELKTTWKKAQGEQSPLLYGNFANVQLDEEKRTYIEMGDHQVLQDACREYLDDFNAMSKKPMDLVLFMDAISHCARIARIIQQPYGNALLVGVGGSGRRSLTELAVSISDMKLVQIEISKTYGMTEWRDDLKLLLRSAGEDGKDTVFLFADTQIKQEDFVEDINNILNTGEVPNLFENDEKSAICESLQKPAKDEGMDDPSNAELMSFFNKRTREHLHIVLAFSPVGDAFRTRLRMFPSLVNCTTIDWFMGWPEEALRSVAMYFLDNEDVGLEKDVLLAVVETCVDMQKRVTELSKKFLQALRRYYYVTPTSYLELIKTFKLLFDTKRVEISTKKGRYQNGLTKILQTAEQVGGMQIELRELQPKLKVAQKETDAKLIIVNKSEKEAVAKEKVVQAIVVECDKTKASAAAMKSECEAMLAIAIPALKSAEKALKSLKKSDIQEIKAFKLPPKGVVVTMEAVCMMLGQAGTKVKNKETGKKEMDFWEVSKKKVLANPKFLEDLLAYDRDNIHPDIVEKVTLFCTRDDFTPAKVKKASIAAAGLCQWVHAMMSYDKVAKVVEPKRIALAKAETDLAAAVAELDERQAELKIVQDALAALQEELRLTMEKKDKLVSDVKLCAERLERAEKLIKGLGGEKARWGEFVTQLQAQYDNVTGDILISSGVVAYLGCFVQSYRKIAVDAWVLKLSEKGISCADNYSIIETLGEPVRIRSWTIDKLPNDSFSISNAIMLNLSKRWPLMIDPQMQANKWVKTMEEKNDLKICRQSQSTFVRTIENACQFGKPVLLEDVPENLDPVLESVLLMQVVKVGGQPSLRVGDNMVALEKGFRLYMTTRLPNPHYPPETCVKINLLNFMATEAGLMDQMLGVTVGAERPDLEKKREELVIQDADNKKQLKEIEDTILELLAKAEGNILDDSVLIETLSQSKVTSNRIEKQVAIAAKTAAKIDKTRESYQPIALRVAILFFCIADLAQVDPMYQYSLNWYINLFLTAIEQAEKSNKIDERLASLVAKFTDILYVNVCRSLFEKDKLLFSFLLSMKVMVKEGKILQEHLRYFLSGNTAVELPEPNPVDDPEDKWLSDKSWGDLLGVSTSFPEIFGWLIQDFKARTKTWRKICETNEPMGMLTELYMGDAHPNMNDFHFLILLRCVRPDCVIQALQQYVLKNMGERFVNPPSFDLSGSYDSSTCETPIIFVLTPGADPMTVLLRLADEKGFTADNGKLFSISLGQGQGPRAENAIANAKDRGTWVVLQNCDLFETWLTTLQRLCEDISVENTHESFRLWLTSMPCTIFPVSVLQNGVKMTLEPPRGMRQSLQGSYLMIDPDWLEDSPRPAAFKKLVFALCFFHATVSERKKFGPLGWNITYGFSTPDLSISLDQMKLFLDEYDEIPWMMLNYCTGQCNYGGRVTDDKDRRCITHILAGFYTKDVLNDDYRFSSSGTFYAPENGDHASYLKYIRQLPLAEGPECYGLHDNAAITSAILETTSTLGTALSLQPRSSGGAAESWESKLARTAGELEKRMPNLFDIERILVAYPTKFEDSMNTILTQEVERFNKLLKRVKTSLRDVQRAIIGEMVMSEELESMGNSLVNGLVPNMWSSVSYPSLKPLGPWILDFLMRLVFINKWVDEDSPIVYWISGFFFTQSFLTGTRQNYARATKIPIDELGFDFQVFSAEDSLVLESKGKPENGAYINGLFMQGAQWEQAAEGCQGGGGISCGAIVDSQPRVLFTPMPSFWLIVAKTQDVIVRHTYTCPTYKTSLRQGQLSTTGHSTNYVMPIELPMRREEDERKWVKAGCAMLCGLDD